MDRIKIFQIIIFGLVLAITLRLLYWQTFGKISGSTGQTFEDQIPAPRGEIYASDNFPLVANQEAFLIYGKPYEIANPKEVAKMLSGYLISEKYATDEAVLSDTDKEAKEKEITAKEEEITQKLSAKNLFWVQLARKVPLSVKEKIQSLSIGGLGFEKDAKRFYPEASMAAAALGFVGSDKFGQDIGYFGLEGYWDRILRGKPGRLGTQFDPFGLPILVGKYRPLPPKKGTSLQLTIDRAMQFMAEEKLRNAVEKYGAREGMVIIADPATGHILAMATYPAYNPALWQEFDEKIYKNPAVADTYEPGSTFKLITTAAALDSGVVTPTTRCQVCTGPREIGGFEISTWNKKYYPDSTVTEIIQHSDNVGMTFVAEKLGTDRFYEYIVKFGFGKLTGIDLQEEQAGKVRDSDEWKPIDLATASFGQGIAVTPIQMIQATGTIAAGGKLISPQLVKLIKDEDKTEEVKPKERQVISTKTAAQVTEMMVASVENGEARAFAPKGYRIAGKTGTAQIPVAGHYDPTKTIASFVGFAPANDPKFVMLVRFTEPTASPFGSETAAPTFFEIAKELFAYFGIPPSK